MLVNLNPIAALRRAFKKVLGNHQLKELFINDVTQSGGYVMGQMVGKWSIWDQTTVCIQRLFDHLKKTYLGSQSSAAEV